MRLYTIVVCVIAGILYCECKESENGIERNHTDRLLVNNSYIATREFAEDSSRSRNGREAIHFKQPLTKNINMEKVRTRQFDIDKAQRRYSTLNSNQPIRRPVQQFYYTNKRQMPYAPRPRQQPQRTRVTNVTPRTARRPTQKRKMKPPRIMF